jgi:Rrf2 family transcriptional regulator, iron-sulfur cluster assembly transcription factor
MLLSRACEYAIRAVLYLAERQDTPYVSVKEIAEQTGVSFHFLGKIVQTLAQHGILVSYKGPHGGVQLAATPQDITVLHVVEAMDGLDVLQQCVLGLPNCGEGRPCALHGQWGRIRADIRNMFQGQSIAELLEASGA